MHFAGEVLLWFLMGGWVAELTVLGVDAPVSTDGMAPYGKKDLVQDECEEAKCKKPCY